MGRRSWCLLLLGVLAAYCIYTPLPENIEEPMLTNTPLKALAHLATFLVEFLGLDFFTPMMIFLEIPPTSHKNVIVTDTKFNNTPVRVYVPRRKSDTLRRSVFYIHGGGWILGSAAFISYDLLSERTADRLNAVIVSTKMRVPKSEDVFKAAPLFKLVNWSSLLPERFLKGHVYKAPTFGSSKLARKHPGFLDVRVAPLLAADSKLWDLPLTYLVTCQYDILRDDGFMYARRLRDAGVPVTHNHLEDSLHGILSFPALSFKIYYRLMDEYMGWLDENL
ncbi:arylacetamide deacetylase [Ictidomys tridecemlineatus]|uniref:arylacetamide deacetylase n=1 Tax=Ictidomys tridecemlineatus TaxID=43179 RepID=UPI000B53B2BC|nr:arylacetamide deacetylase [Ictidomys tridecemlineatus]KAG3270887.1 arylacetamide deacetylase [Ictidomys tridecemlineatus]